MAGTWRAPMKSNGVYWIGRDGNVYVKGDKGTNMAGRADANTANYWGSRGFGQIADPVPQQPGADQRAAQTAPTGGSGGGSGSAPAPKPDRSNSIALNLAGLGSLDSTFQSNNAAIDSQLNSAFGDYDKEVATAKTRYDENNVNNNVNFQKDYQTSLVNAAKGRQAIFGSLAKIGALNGDGIVLANRAIKDTANQDVSTSEDTRDANAGMLKEKWEDFEDEDNSRRATARREAEALKQQNRGNIAKNRQEYYTKLSNDYAEMGNEGEAKRYANMAGGLFGEVALASTPANAIGRQNAAFTPSTLADIQPGSDMSVSLAPAQPGQAAPGLVAGSKKKKETVAV